MKMKDIDLLDLDRFLAQEHHEMFNYLRKENPVSWHDEPDGPGFWNVVLHADLVEVNRNAEILVRYHNFVLICIFLYKS